MWVIFANAKTTHIFFSKNISVYAILNDQSLKDMLTENIISSEQLGPGHSLNAVKIIWNFLKYQWTKNSMVRLHNSLHIE